MYPLCINTTCKGLKRYITLMDHPYLLYIYIYICLSRWLYLHFMPLKRFVRVLCNQRNIVCFVVNIVLTEKRRYRSGKWDIYMLKKYLIYHQASINMDLRRKIWSPQELCLPNPWQPWLRGIFSNPIAEFSNSFVRRAKCSGL